MKLKADKSSPSCQTHSQLLSINCKIVENFVLLYVNFSAFFFYERERTWMSYDNVKEQDDGFCLCRGEGVFRESVTPSAARNSWWCYNSSGELVIVSAGFMRYGWTSAGCLPCVPSDKGGALTKSTPLTKDNRNVNSTIRKFLIYIQRGNILMFRQNIAVYRKCCYFQNNRII